jgi:hypothetical protein
MKNSHLYLKQHVLRNLLQVGMQWKNYYYKRNKI